MRCVWLILVAYPFSSVAAQGLIAGDDAELTALADAYDRQIHGLMTVELGWGLEAYVSNPDDRAAVEAFMASGQRDFQAATGRHPYEVVDRFGEYGDLGMFGGVQAAGDAFRYAVLRDEGAPAAQVDQARADLIRALDGMHWYTAVTGVPGVMARGIRRRLPAEGDPALPELPDTVPLRDGAGNPLPAVKEPTWREDNSGELPFLIWLDDTSKDQVDGYIFALGAAYDVIANDPTIDASYTDRLVDDARAIAQRLMTVVEVSPDNRTDLVLQDADGRITTFHDLAAEELGGVVMPRALNGFNAVMSLGMMRTLYHITGDTDVGEHYYRLIEERGYLDAAELNITLVYVGTITNYSNVNMAMVAMYGLLRYETEMLYALRARGILETLLYAPGENREAAGLGQSWFDFLYAGFRVGGNGSDGASAVTRGIQTLREFDMPPYWQTDVINCDEAELAAMSCVAVDGVTPITIAETLGRGGIPVATEPLPKRLRPDDNFEWRSDPHRVNGTAGSRLNPGGGFHGAYWMGRYLQQGDSGFHNVSPLARERTPVPPPTDGGVVDDASVPLDAGVAVDAAGVDAGEVTDGGGGCSVGSLGVTGWWVLLFVGRRRNGCELQS